MAVQKILSTELENQLRDIATKNGVIDFVIDYDSSDNCKFSRGKKLVVLNLKNATIEKNVVAFFFTMVAYVISIGCSFSEACEEGYALMLEHGFTDLFDSEQNYTFNVFSGII